MPLDRESAARRMERFNEEVLALSLCPFTEEELEEAADEWGCNCGPATLAFACQLKLDKVRTAIPGFTAKGFTNPTMMKEGLRRLGYRYEAVSPQCFRIQYLASNPGGALDGFGSFIVPQVAIIRLQWTGRWTERNAHPGWAYRHTHWIAAWDRHHEVGFPFPWVYDINSGATPLLNWVSHVVPALLPQQGDGGYYPTHVWRLAPDGKA
ncbi:MAG TPA: hypothetical protein VI756_10410 [Blastocatellia bacterium]